MPQLLHLDASARRASLSRRTGAAFADAWRAATPQHTYVHRDLAARPVPPIGEAWTTICDTLLREGIVEPARYREAVRTDAQREAWAVLEPLLTELLAADVVLIGTPMYNFGVPAQLKLWIDQVTFPRMDLRPRRFVIASARGGSYRPGTPRAPFDHQERYLVDFFRGHYGVEDTLVIGTELANSTVDPALAERLPQHEQSLAAALAEAAAAGRRMAREASEAPAGRSLAAALAKTAAAGRRTADEGSEAPDGQGR
ncbi:FMN-dependent NADH-azoreductase [Kitasatospora sp. NPDC048194]|uniref:FMN-dependent NADH-azoreductase n=1 Tax=Kitasatospora sp. NPDC048194 TaxID=3364045 RepID=UPI003722E561